MTSSYSHGESTPEVVERGTFLVEDGGVDMDREDSSDADFVSSLNGISPRKGKPRVLRQRNGTNSDSSGGWDAGVATISGEILKGGELLPLMNLPFSLSSSGRIRKHSDFDSMYESLPASAIVNVRSDNSSSSSSSSSIINNNNNKPRNSKSIGQLRSRDDIVQHFMVELHMLWRDSGIIFLGTVMQWVHSVLTNIAYYYQTQLSAAQRVPLKDIAYETLPTLDGSWWIASEYIVYTMLTITVLAMVSILVIRWHPPHGRPLYSVPILRRMLITLTVCQILRCISFLCTTLPGASRQCLYSVPEDMTKDELLNGPARDTGNPVGWAPPVTVSDILWRVDATTGCGDLMFSSHTIFTMTFVCLIWRYFNWQLLRWAMLLMQVGLVVWNSENPPHRSLTFFLFWFRTT
jgi:sphingomyelin synthase-related protein 1